MKSASQHKHRPIGLRSFASVGVVSIALLLIAVALNGDENVRNRRSASPKQNLTSTMGMWTPPRDLCTPDHHCLVGANAAVLATGYVLYYYYPDPSGQQSRAVVLQPGTGVVTNVGLPSTLKRDIFCSGISIMPNGQVLVTGGNSLVGMSQTSGTFNTTIFSPLSYTWSAGQNMNYARWYPSTLELADGSMLELSGVNETGTKIQNELETYDYKTNTWTVLPASANMSANILHSTAYPRLVLLPSGNAFLAAPDAKSYQFDPLTNVWSFVATNNFGSRYFAPHVLLPGLEKVLVAGGTQLEPRGGGPATNTAEVIDFSVPNPSWSYTGSMTYARYNSNLVLLADGEVLAVGGGAGGGNYTNPVLTPELYDPKSGKWTVMAAQIVQRTYHSTAVLLPDGRVISAGSDNRGSMQQTYEIFSPPYLFRGRRPVIASAPRSLTYGGNFTIATADAASIARVALLRPGSTTHADNFDQRYVDLSFNSGSGQITASAPASGNYAPPGYYMLVIVNSYGIPSVMPFVQLSYMSCCVSQPYQESNARPISA